MRPEFPPAYGGCRCACHRLPGYHHIKPCCVSPRQMADMKQMQAEEAPEKESMAVPAGLLISIRLTLERIAWNTTENARGEAASQLESMRAILGKEMP